MSNGSPGLIHVFRSPSIHLQLQRSHKPGCASSRSGAVAGRGRTRSVFGPKGSLTPRHPRRTACCRDASGPELQVDSQQYICRQCAKAARRGGARSAFGPNFRRSISSKAHYGPFASECGGLCVLCGCIAFVCFAFASFVSMWRLLQLVCCMFFGSPLLTICLCACWLRPLFVHAGRWPSRCLCTFPVRPVAID